MTSYLIDDSRNGRKKEKNRRKKRGVKIPNVAKPVAKTAKTGGKILFKFINFLLRMGTLLLIAWIIYLLGLHFLTNVGPFGNIISRLTAADQELIAYLAVAGVLLFSVFSAEAGSRAVMEIPSITAGGLHPLSLSQPALICLLCLQVSFRRFLPHSRESRVH